MNEFDYKIKLNELFKDFDKKKESLYKEYALSNALFKNGDMIKDESPAFLVGAVSGSVFSNDLFATPLIEQPKISKDEFVRKAKLILEKIWSEYGHAFEKPLMEEKELDVAPCEKCNGCMNWKYFDEEIQCIQDIIEGDCRKIVLNTDVFGSVVENLIQSDDYQYLISSDVF